MIYSIVTLSIFILTFIYAFLKYIFSYWERHDFPYLEPKLIFGNMKSFVLRQRSFGLAIWDLFEQARGKPFVGIYLLTNPGVLIRDTKLVKSVLVQDFDSFYDRGLYINKKREPFSAFLGSERGQDWKVLRQKLTPLFSSGRLKNIFPTMADVAQNMEDYLMPKAKNNEIVGMSDIFKRYALDVIGTIFFGNDVNTMDNPKQEFYRMNYLLNCPEVKENFRMGLLFVAPKMLDLLRMSPLNLEVKKFFMELTATTIAYRENNKIHRNDFMQLLLDLRESEKGTAQQLTIEQIASNCMMFYNAGTETTSGTIGFLLYELALQPEIMEKVQCEIDEALKMNNGKISYDMLQEMEYLELCLKETLRKYPGLPILNRECTRDYKIPGTDYVIKKGISTVISVMGLHYNPENFPDPYKFDPERFRKGQENYNKDAYMPFGDGPKQCIAVRMGFLEVKLAAVQLLSKFTFTTIDNKEMEFDGFAIALQAKNGLPLKISMRK